MFARLGITRMICFAVTQGYYSCCRVGFFTHPDKLGILTYVLLTARDEEIWLHSALTCGMISMPSTHIWCFPLGAHSNTAAVILPPLQQHAHFMFGNRPVMLDAE